MDTEVEAEIERLDMRIERLEAMTAVFTKSDLEDAIADNVWDALNKTAATEGGLCLIDRDGAQEILLSDESDATIEYLHDALSRAVDALVLQTRPHPSKADRRAAALAIDEARKVLAETEPADAGA